MPLDILHGVQFEHKLTNGFVADCPDMAAVRVVVRSFFLSRFVYNQFSLARRATSGGIAFFLLLFFLESSLLAT